MPMEFKSKDGGKDKIDDCRKMMWSLNMVMRTDARRRFVHGLTCENTTGRLWYGDRSDIVASEEFDINKDWRCLVRIILSTVLAREDQLGYDPSVVARFFDNSKLEPVYDITIYNSKTKDTAIYRTIDVISDAGADNSVGRGTRVWSTQEMKDGKPVGPVYVLKGIWVHPGRPAEHAILEEIREKQPEYSRYFLTPVNHGFAPLEPTNASVLFDTHSPLGRKRDWKPTGQVLGMQTNDSMDAKTPSGTRNSVGPELVSKPAEEEFRGFRRLSTDSRQLYWIVFKERGTPVHDLTDFTDIFTAIRGAWEGLHAIHLCDYVHRDVSSGNVLLVPASPLDNLPERGVIMDLEYCKKVTDTSGPGDVRTGTEDFMATEVACAEYSRLADIRCVKPPVDWAAAIKVHKFTNQPERAPLPSFRYNLLHDMESIWWLCIWMMLRLVPSGADPSVWITSYHNVFGNVDARTRFLEKTGEFLKHTSHLSELRLLCEPIGFWQSALNDFYDMAYRQFNESPGSLTVIRIDSKMLQLSYDVGREVLRTMWEASSQLSTTFAMKRPRTQHEVITKRFRTETQSPRTRPSTPQAGRSVASNSSSRKLFQSNDVVFPVSKKRRINKSQSPNNV
ncbi:unnamed protein product [Rhizoctonia solani]|uniref:Fungal-type protein kinase domain-containing protein n=1 Tax=Rhizoctonia solani TaxID=456999 RepID=A0A8H3E241_9AGAM|nr:unnamed protein product [Rhizoctonia solani]